MWHCRVRSYLRLAVGTEIDERALVADLIAIVRRREDSDKLDTYNVQQEASVGHESARSDRVSQIAKVRQKEAFQRGVCLGGGGDPPIGLDLEALVLALV